MADLSAGFTGWGLAFLVSAGVVLEAIAACCSSPQTAEINAHQRAETLMKWVYLGTALAVVLILLAASIDRAHWHAILAGGGLTAALMLILYRHAMQAGLASAAPGTEQ